jgi:ATP-dependent Clp protease ATP-binding subunit ClpA
VFDRFTPTAVDAIGAAGDEAARLGADHVGPEHLLLSLAAGDPDEDAAARVLDQLGVTAPALRESLRYANVDASAATAGGAMQDDEPDLPWTAEARRVLQLAADAADASDAVGPEHVLLGLLALASGAATDALADCGVTPDQLRQALARV